MQTLKSHSQQSILSDCEGTEILQSSCRQPALKPVNIHHICCRKQMLAERLFTWLLLKGGREIWKDKVWLQSGEKWKQTHWQLFNQWTLACYSLAQTVLREFVSPHEETGNCIGILFFFFKEFYRDCQSMCDVHCRTAIIAKNQLLCVWPHLHGIIMS